MLHLSPQSAENDRILLAHLLPMLDGIRGIFCATIGIDMLEQHFPGTLARAQELHLYRLDSSASIPTYLNWLTAPREVYQNNPLFLRMSAKFEYITAIVEAVCKVFVPAKFNFFL